MEEIELLEINLKLKSSERPQGRIEFIKGDS